MSRRALSLSAYLTFARGAQAPSEHPPLLPDRKTGPLLMAYGETPSQGSAMAALCARLVQQRPEVQVVLFGCAAAHADGTDMIGADLPPERASACDAFAEEVRPDVVLWAGQNSLRPALLHSLCEQGAQLIALDAQNKQWASPAPRWLPDPAPATLALFHKIHATSPAAGRALRRLGVAPDNLRISGPLQDAGMPLGYNEDSRDDLAVLLGGRPVWLAAHLRAGEVHDILRAHRRAVRMAHRLLLIIAPHEEAEAPAIARAIEAEKMRCANWDAGETPEDNTLVLMAEGPEELGLWYRAAPLVFMGGSLIPGHGGHDPMEASALGAAILYGPNVGGHLASYTRLVEAGAARIVRDADSLASALTNLTSPDQAASMAYAGWEVATASAALVDQVVTEVCEALDRKEHA